MSYGEWEATVPGTLKADAIWRVQAYRLASYVGSEAGFDADTVAERRWLVKSAGQLASAAESVSANIAEGLCSALAEGSHPVLRIRPGLRR